MSELPAELELLFSPIALGRTEVKNRIVVAPMERSYANPDGTVTDRMIAHYEGLARGGAGLITVESAYIDPVGSNRRHQLGIHTDACVDGLGRLVGALHRHDAKATIQLQHAGRNSRESITGLTPVAPSALPTPYGEIAHALTAEEIEEVFASYGRAARRASDAGFDAIELHSAHGYLPQAFLSPLTNTRTDEYGGDLPDRMRFTLRLLAVLREHLADHVTLGCRFSVVECLPGGLTMTETTEYARALVKAGCEYLSVSAGTHASFKWVIPPMDVAHGWLLPMAAKIRAAVDVPVVGVGRLTDPAHAAGALAAGQVDLVAMGRAFLTDPQWPTKARTGHAGAIVHCIGCNQGCAARVKDGRDVTCLVNPVCGRELEFTIEPAAAVRKVAVIGGGPAGMEAARVAAERGHDVVLYEREPELGGQARLAGLLPHRDGWATFVQDGARRLAASDVDVRLGAAIGPSELMELDADAVVIATGAAFTRPAIDGAAAHATDVATVLRSGRAPGARVLVAGGDVTALGVCEWLLAQGSHVTLLTEEADIAEPMEQLGVIERLNATARFEIVTERSVRRIDSGVVHTALSGSIAPLDAGEIAADCVVFAERRQPAGGLGWLAREHLPRAEIHVIGDADDPRSALEAVLEGAKAGRAI